jgi:hypothetical protein
MVNEWHDLLDEILVVHPLHPAPVEWMRALVVDGVARVGIDAEELDASLVDKVGNGAHELLVEILPLVPAAGRERHDRRTIMSGDHDPELAAYPS